jgi:hypothetical protein
MLSKLCINTNLREWFLNVFLSIDKDLPLYRFVFELRKFLEVVTAARNFKL